MTSPELLAYVQRLLDPPPPRFGHELSHDELTRWADEGRERESP